MSEAVVSVVADVLARLETRVGAAGWPAPEAGFAAEVMLALDAEGETSARRRELVAAAVDDTDLARWREAPVLAAAGYVLHASFELMDRWVEGGTRLAERDPFPPDRASFFYRPVELLGLARGAVVAGAAAESFRTWLADVVRDGEMRVPGDIWHRALGAAAADVLGVPWSLSVTVSDIETAGVDEIALIIWLSTNQPGAAERLLGSDERLQVEQLELRLLERVLLEPLDVGDAARAAVIAATVRRAIEAMLESAHAARWQLDRDERDATELIANLCRRFPRFARQLATRHDNRAALTIDDEFDVQDALHALLQLHFDDVRPEEWAPSYAGSRTRMDFLLKRERTVVETKMMRKGLDQRKAPRITPSKPLPERTPARFRAASTSSSASRPTASWRWSLLSGTSCGGRSSNSVLLLSHLGANGGAGLTTREVQSRQRIGHPPLRNVEKAGSTEHRH